MLQEADLRTGLEGKRQETARNKGNKPGAEAGAEQHGVPLGDVSWASQSGGGGGLVVQCCPPVGEPGIAKAGTAREPSMGLAAPGIQVEGKNHGVLQKQEEDPQGAGGWACISAPQQDPALST